MFMFPISSKVGFVSPKLNFIVVMYAVTEVIYAYNSPETLSPISCSINHVVMSLVLFMFYPFW